MSFDMAKELEKTLHIDGDDVPWVPMIPGLEQRVLHWRPEVDWYVTQLRAQPFAETNLHRHTTPIGIGGYTLRGRWGHDRQYLYRPGTYIFETPGVVHKFFNGPEVTEVIFFGVGKGDIEFIESDNVTVKDALTPERQIEGYLEGCAKHGVDPHFLK